MTPRKSQGAARIFIVSGPGGVGKGTIVTALVERDPNLWLSRSWTTRDQRSGESDSAYVFTDRAAFEAQGARDHHEDVTCADIQIQALARRDRPGFDAVAGQADLGEHV